MWQTVFLKVLQTKGKTVGIVYLKPAALICSVPSNTATPNEFYLYTCSHYCLCVIFEVLPMVALAPLCVYAICAPEYGEREMKERNFTLPHDGSLVQDCGVISLALLTKFVVHFGVAL